MRRLAASLLLCLATVAEAQVTKQMSSELHWFPGGIRGAVQDKGGAVYNVKAYGAKGDGTTDDTTAIASALTACGTSPGIVFMPKGTYVIEGLTVPTGCTLAGAGIGATVLELDTSLADGPGTIIASGTANAYTTDVVIRDFTVDGNKAEFDATDHIVGVRVAGSRILVENVYVHDVTAACIGVGLGTGTMGNITVQNNWCHNPGSTNPTANYWGAYFIVHGSNIAFLNNIHTRSDTDSGYGFDIEPNTGQSVSNVQVEGGFYTGMLKIAGLSGDTTDHVRVVGGTYECVGQSGGGRGVSISYATDVELAHVYVEGPADSSTGNTVAIDNSTNVRMLGGTYKHRAGSSRSRLKIDTGTTITVDGTYWDINSGNAQVVEEITSNSDFQWLNSLVNGSGNGFWHTKLSGSTPYIRLTQTAQTFAQLPTLVRSGSEVLCSDCLRTNPCVGGGSGSTTIARRVGGAWNCAVSGEPSATVTTQTVADDGAGTAASFTITATRGALQVTCNDTHGCAATMSETGMTTGDILYVENVSANTVTIADSSGVVETTGGTSISLGQYETAGLIYLSDRWTQLFTN